MKLWQITQSTNKLLHKNQISRNSSNSGEDELNELYTNPTVPSGYSGDLKKFIMQKESISRHKRKINIFKRRKVVVFGPWVAIQAATAFYISSASKNDGFKYILGESLIFATKFSFCKLLSIVLLAGIGLDQ